MSRQRIARLLKLYPVLLPIRRRELQHLQQRMSTMMSTIVTMTVVIASMMIMTTLAIAEMMVIMPEPIAETTEPMMDLAYPMEE
ncbi:hypothetical protein CY34DRAFT_810944 [Suillus luteus UH-Slu-Lm8-n1]|uniref:Uncharacterized protein n=1 Tax=Suillus luteus UH-Slu-Lm8-n1 TaxID=930992 RepID=A0A0D0ARB8_9AGAM|nr:hypothetical protein CY34DRAFT_810944 [Suillus luteus UH-Slu-Lm8-n1]